MSVIKTTCHHNFPNVFFDELLPSVVQHIFVNGETSFDVDPHQKGKFEMDDILWAHPFRKLRKVVSFPVDCIMQVFHNGYIGFFDKTELNFVLSISPFSPGICLILSLHFDRISKLPDSDKPAVSILVMESGRNAICEIMYTRSACSCTFLRHCCAISIERASDESSFISTSLTCSRFSA